MTQIYLTRQATIVSFASREASAAGRLRSNGLIGNWEPEKLPQARFFN